MANRHTHVIAIDPQAPDPQAIGLAAELLRSGRLVAFPTETVYGLGANAYDEAAVAQIFAAKGRPATDPLIVHLAALADLETIAQAVPALAYQLAARFWPGPLTLVLRRRPIIPASVSAGLDTVAVRVPAHPIARALLECARVPIAAPSANRFARPSPTTAQHVLDDLAGRVDLILDGGPTAIGLESTVLDLTCATPTILRPGGISLELLRLVVPEVAFVPRYLTSETAATAPGSLLKHYSPDAELRLIHGPLAAVHRYIRAEVDHVVAAGQRVGVLAVDEDLPALAGIAAMIISLGAEAEPETVGRLLFARIRELDQHGVDLILVRGLAQNGLGLAIWDRLVRAAEGHVVEVV
jgi:L-threonylcarbamoyladenylate synthase